MCTFPFSDIRMERQFFLFDICRNLSRNRLISPEKKLYYYGQTVMPEKSILFSESIRVIAMQL